MALKINGVRVAGVGSNGKDGAGVVAGGAAGQILTKKTDIDYDTEWTDLPPIDPTLSIEGQAADAKIVGDALAAKQPVGDYALKSDIPTDYIKSIPDEYVTDAELTAKGYLTEHQSLEGLATEEYVNSAITNINTYYTKAEIDNMEFITLDEIDAICARTIEVVTPTTGTF